MLSLLGLFQPPASSDYEDEHYYFCLAGERLFFSESQLSSRRPKQLVGTLPKRARTHHRLHALKG
jgi:hypothetical protein